MTEAHPDILPSRSRSGLLETKVHTERQGKNRPKFPGGYAKTKGHQRVRKRAGSPKKKASRRSSSVGKGKKTGKSEEEEEDMEAVAEVSDAESPF